MSTFPLLAPISEDQKYKAVLQESQLAYSNFNQQDAKKVKKLDDLTREWSTRYTSLKNGTLEPRPSIDLLKTEFTDRIKEYVSLRDHRQEIRDLLITIDKIIAQYDKAIAYCQPPALDLTTLGVFQKMGSDMAAFKRTYEKTFIIGPRQLNEERTKLLSLREIVKLELAPLRQALELLGEVVTAKNAEEKTFISTLSTASWNVTMGVVYSALKQTPIVNEAVRTFIAARTLAAEGKSEEGKTA